MLSQIETKTRPPESSSDFMEPGRDVNEPPEGLEMRLPFSLPDMTSPQQECPKQKRSQPVIQLAFPKCQPYHCYTSLKQKMIKKSAVSTCPKTRAHHQRDIDQTVASVLLHPRAENNSCSFQNQANLETRERRRACRKEWPSVELGRNKAPKMIPEKKRWTPPVRPIKEHAFEIAKEYAMQLSCTPEVAKAKKMIKKALDGLQAHKDSIKSPARLQNILLSLQHSIKSGSATLKFIVAMVHYGCWSGMYVTQFLIRVLELLGG